MMLYIALALLVVCIWLPIRKPTYRWEMLIYGTPIVFPRGDAEEFRWRRLSYVWRSRDVT